MVTMRPCGRQLMPAAFATAALGTVLIDDAMAQPCPTPVIVSSGECALPATPVVTSTANPAAVTAIGGAVTGTGATLNLNVAGSTGIVAQGAPSRVSLVGSVIQTTSTGSAASSHTGVRATLGAVTDITGSTITIGPTANTSNLVGVSADSGAEVSLTGTTLTMQGGAAGNSNHALVALGSGGAAGRITVSGGSVSTVSRGAYAAFASNGGFIALNGGVDVSTSGVPVPSGSPSHALFATGAGSRIETNDATVTAAGSAASAARAEDQASMSLVNSKLSTTGAASGAAVAAVGTGTRIDGTGLTLLTSGATTNAARAEAGAAISLTGGSATTSGAAAHVAFATGAGSSITGSGVTLTSAATGTSGASGARAEAGASLSFTDSVLSSTSKGTSASNGAVVRAIDSSATLVDTTIDASQAFEHGVWVQGGAGTLDMRGGSTVNVAGTSSHGVLVSAGASAAIDSSTIRFTGAVGYALFLTGAGSNATLSNTSLFAQDPTTPNAAGAAMRVTQGASATMSAGSIISAGNNQRAAWVNASGSSLVANNVAFSTSGEGESPGLVVDGSPLGVTPGSATLTGGTIAASGNPLIILGETRLAIGMVARLPGALLTTTGTTVSTTGSSARGVVADDGGTVNMSGGSVKTTGTSAAGLYAMVEQTGPIFGATINAAGTSIETFGERSHGAFASRGFHESAAKVQLSDTIVITHANDASGARAVQGGAVVIDGGSARTSGIDAYGVLARDAQNGLFSSVAMSNGTTVTTAGANAHGVVAQDGAQVSGNAVNVAATGEGASALFVTSATGVPSLASFTGSVLRSSSGAAIAMAGPGLVTLSGATVGASGNWLRVEPLGVLPPLTASEPVTSGLTDDSDFAGDGSVVGSPQKPGVVRRAPDPSSTAVTASASLLEGSATTGVGATSNVALADGTRWSMTGDSNITNLSNAASQINFAPPATSGGFKTLSVVNYTSQNGFLGLNTHLGTDGSPSDKLVVDGGAATGTTGIGITNAGGRGALTRENGIKVVDAQNAATTAVGAFALSGRAVAGPYEYRLVRGGRSGSNQQSWYLRSERPDDPIPPPAPPPPAPSPPAPDPRPLYRPEVGAYLANERNAAGMFLHSLHDRLGEPQWIEHQSFDKEDNTRRGAWVRIVGKDIDATSRDGNFDVASTNYLVHGGGDFARWSVAGEQDRLHLGAMLGYGWSSSDSSAAGNVYRAKGKTEGPNLGLYATWYQNDADPQKLGWYADAWGTIGWYKNSVQGDLLPEVKYDSRALTVSGETGYAFRVRDDSDWIVEPQVQLAWLRMDVDSVTEPNGTQVAGHDGSGWIGRVGIRTHRTWVDDAGKRIQPYLTVNYWMDHVDDDVRFNEVMLNRLYPDNRWEVKLGVNADLNKGWTAWSNLGYQWGAQSYRATTVRLGAKYTW